MTEEPDFERTLEAGAALVQYVRSHFPKPFYCGERGWRVTLSAVLLCMADTVEHLTSQATTMPEVDALTLLRSVFERAITVAWILVDPDVRSQIWHQDSVRHSRAIVDEIRGYGLEIADPPAGRPELPRLPNADVRADEADAHWAGRVDGLYGAGHHYSFRGLYTIIYRTGSASAHGALSSANGYQDWSGRPVIVQRPEPSDLLWPALAVPVFAMTLCVAATEIQWIDDARVRATTPGRAVRNTG